MTDPQPMQDEPTFALMGRDTFAPALVRLWAAQRRLEVRAGSRPVSDLDQIERAERTAERMEDWRRDADEAWRTQPQLALGDVDGTLYTPGVPEAGKDGWIAWAGGECPVPKDTLVLVKFRDMPSDGSPDPAGVWIWHHIGITRADIVAYKVVGK